MADGSQVSGLSSDMLYLVPAALAKPALLALRDNCACYYSGKASCLSCVVQQTHSMGFALAEFYHAQALPWHQSKCLLGLPLSHQRFQVSGLTSGHASLAAMVSLPRVSQTMMEKTLAMRHALDVQQTQDFIMQAAAADMDLARLLLQRLTPEP